MRLGAALDLPLRDQNALLLAAGYAPFWPQGSLESPELAEVSSALNFMLEQQEPYPAVVVDRRWNLIRANRGATRLVALLSDGEEPQSNLAMALVSPDHLRRYLVNWPEVIAYFLRGVQSDALADGTPETADLLAKLLAFPEVASLALDKLIESSSGPVLSMHFERDGVSLRLFTTIATLGTPLDITLQELRIECFFPADAATSHWFHNLR